MHVQPLITEYKRVKKVDNPLPLITTINNLHDFTVKQNVFMLSNRLTYSGFRTLIDVVGLYCKEGKAVSKFKVYKLANTLNGSHQSIFGKVNHLEKVGLLEVVGFDVKGCSMYAPTSKALKELSDLLQ